MNSLRPNFQSSKQMVSAGFLIAVFGIFLFVTTAPIIYAGGLPAPPAWYPVEMQAINLYQFGINQESSDPAAAVKTLLQARKDSTIAISNGGGTNPAVVHNDLLIAKALMTAQTDVAKTPGNQDAADSQNSDGNNSAKRGGYHVQTISAHMATQQQQMARRSVQ